MAAPCAVTAADETDALVSAQGTPECPTNGKRQQFGNRFLVDPSQVFQHNAWDNVEWTEEQEAAAKRKVQENSQPLPSEKQGQYDLQANEYWNDFYKIHQNRFFKDRHWLFTEFPELAQNCQQHLAKANPLQDNAEKHVCHLARDKSQDVAVTTITHAEDSAIAGCDFPGSTATYRIMEVGCGVGNTVFPILKTNNDPGLFVYCCDFSSTAVELVKTNEEYDPHRCFAFIHNLSDPLAEYPVPEGSLDVIVLIFVLSALHPDKMQTAVTHLARLLKPGGVILLRDYGRYDMAQLRFKKGRCLSENFYVRGDGTCVYFFTQDELHDLFTNAALEKVQNLVDRRLQVNRGKQLTMHRVWIQCKYCKPFGKSGT